MAHTAVIGAAIPPNLHVMTFNIRRRLAKVNRRSPDLWNRRRPAIRHLLTTERPTILGVQEALLDQAEFVSEVLGPHYRRLGRGRNADGAGEACPLYFDTERLHLDNWTQLALSATPTEPGSRSWGNLVPRVAVCAGFIDKITGLKFRVINTHFDQMSRRARLMSADLITRTVASAGEPVMVTGDFNTSAHTAPYRHLTIAGELTDTWLAAKTRLTEEWGTFPNYRRPKEERKRIDWILVSDGIEVESAAINPAKWEGIAASDHLPVQTIVRLRR